MQTTLSNLQTVRRREKLLWVLSAATFIIFFQAYMIAPLIPKLATLFNCSEQQTGYVVPAYLIPYGITTLFYGLLADRISPKIIILLSMFAFSLLTAFTALSNTVEQLTLWRLFTGIGASGVIPLSLALTAQMFPFEERGRPLGWLFGAMAGGSAFGSTIGVMLEPIIGWQGLFIGISVLGLLLVILLWKVFQGFQLPKPSGTLSLKNVLNGYLSLARQRRGFQTYAYVLLNGLFHAGVFTWLGLYFKERYQLNEWEIGFAILGYGLPGFILGPVIGKMADRQGRRWLIPLGLLISALAAFSLAFHLPLLLAALAVTALSLGYDLTQPLLAGIVTDVGKKQPGQAMGLNVFMLFLGFGIGSFFFGHFLYLGLKTDLMLFTLFQALLTLGSLYLFKSEQNINQLNSTK